MVSSELYPYCEICPIIEDPQPEDIDYRIHEGDYWRLTLRGGNQSLLGTTFITLKEHRESLADLTLAEDEEFIVIRNRLIRALDGAFKPDGINLSCLMNYAFRSNGDPDFIPQPHVHWHAKPRYKLPRIVGGEHFTDPEFADYLRIGRGHRVSTALGRSIVGRIKEHF